MRQIFMSGSIKALLAVCLTASLPLSSQRPPSPTDLTSHPFFITKTWIVGGAGEWGYMTMDPVARQLFIAHGPAVQVVDVAAGTLAGSVTGLREARSVALDPAGEFGYITDGPADQVRVFDRRTLQVVASIPTGPAPRSLALDQRTKLLLVVGAQSPSETPGVDTRSTARAGEAGGSTAPKTESTITVVDAEARKQLAQIVLPGSLGLAEADGKGRVYITVSDRNQILRLDAQAISSVLQRAPSSPALSQTPTAATNESAALLDWASGAPPAEARPRTFSLGDNCEEPRALAVDSPHSRIFVACTNMKMAVLNSDTGASVASVPIGPGADGVAYDPDRGLIFSANGGAQGSLTIIRQDVTDTYSVVQILPTRQRARTVAVNPSTGEIYLVTVLYGAELNRPPINGAPLKMSSVDSSFQVLVVGN